MGSYFWDSNTSNTSNYSGIFGPNSGNLGGFSGNLRGGSVSQSLVLDSERGEIVKAPARVGKKHEVSEENIKAALKNHSEAERRRRERINAHLSTLRGLVPCTEKMDKAALLAEVISQVKQLKKTTTETSEGLLIPMDTDEVRVESHKDGDGTFSFRASLCCDYPARTSYVFVFTSREEMNSDNSEECQILVNSVHRSLSTILDKVSAAAEYSPRTTLPNKRRRISFFDSSSSSS
ncbi:hypothetical protein Acr_00g0101230 [Actinidia rufa]|uniref:BHLH domain-containing protein n=1 Tax=Actinidia rufa TaxID=165716 RepID=A0A7J0E091_9ERIC|nr:hypothetical protein Acr_00g0101230 [Actinidia rufa]